VPIIKRLFCLEFPLAVAIFFSLVLRLSYPNAIEFKGDEYTALKLAYSHVHGGGLALVGLESSVGLPNPPFFIYVLSVPVSIFAHPVFVTLFIALLNVLGVGMLFWFLWRYFSPRIAFLATAVFASAPWTIVFSRKIWAQDLLFPFLMATYLLLAGLVTRYRRWKFVLFAVLFAIVTQLHLSAWFLPVPFLVFFVVTGVKPRARDAILGSAAFIFMYAPYLFFHFQDGFQTVGRVLSSNVDGTYKFGESTRSIARAVKASTGLEFEILIGSGGMSALEGIPGISLSLFVFNIFVLIAFVSLLAFVAGYVKRACEKGRIAGMALDEGLLFLMVVTFLFGQICYVILDLEPHLHYQIVFYPLFSLLIICSLARVAGLGKTMKVMTNAFILLLVISQLYFAACFEWLVANRPETIDGDYGTPYYLRADDWEKHLAREYGTIERKRY
jgi:hypothetical protein